MRFHIRRYVAMSAIIGVVVNAGLLTLSEPATADTLLNRVVIGFNGPVPGDIESTLASRSASLAFRDDVLNFVVAETATGDALQSSFADDPTVAFTEYDSTAHLQETEFAVMCGPVLVLTTSFQTFLSSGITCDGGGGGGTLPPPPQSDPLYNQVCGTHYCQWGPRMIKADEAWTTTTGTSSVVIAVVDTGVDYHHEDLSANIKRVGGQVDGINLADPTKPANNPDDDCGHGTFVAGIAAAKIKNDKGLKGIAQASIMPVKVFSCTGGVTSGYGAVLASGVGWAAAHDADIITASWKVADSAVLRRAVEFARDRGSLIVAAAGNVPETTVVYPAAYPSVIAVSGVDLSGAFASTYSVSGAQVALSAPGGTDYPSSDNDIQSTFPGNLYAWSRGTSFAAPYVAGTAALVLSVDSQTSAADVRTILESTATDKGPIGKDPEYGYGVVNAAAAVALAAR